MRHYILHNANHMLMHQGAVKLNASRTGSEPKKKGGKMSEASSGARGVGARCWPRTTSWRRCWPVTLRCLPRSRTSRATYSPTHYPPLSIATDVRAASRVTRTSRSRPRRARPSLESGAKTIIYGLGKLAHVEPSGNTWSRVASRRATSRDVDTERCVPSA